MAMSKDKLAGILSGKAPKARSDEEMPEDSDDGLEYGAEEETDDGDVDLRVDLAADVSDALRSKDDVALADALEAFLDHCYASREE